MIGIGVIGTLMNTYGAKHLPVLEGIVLIVHIFGFFCIIIPLWVLAPKAPASEVFGTFENFGGWSSVGAACFVGSITATGSFAGSDAAVHLSEETKDASKSVPRMIMFTIVLNGLMGLVFIITYVSSNPPSPFATRTPREWQEMGKRIHANRIIRSASASPISRLLSCQKARSPSWM
jgi:choline transport protein